MNSLKSVDIQHLFLRLHWFLTYMKSSGFTSWEKPLKLFYLTRLLDSVHSYKIKQWISTMHKLLLMYSSFPFGIIKLQ